MIKIGTGTFSLGLAGAKRIPTAQSQSIQIPERMVQADALSPAKILLGYRCFTNFKIVL